MNSTNNKYPPPFLVKILQFLGLAISKILWRIEYKGIENIPQKLKSGLIIAANHQSYFDPFWICLKIKNRKFRFMAWDKAFDWFLIGDFIRYLGAFPVSLERGGTLKALKNALEFLDEGATLTIFPEGEREFSDGKMLPFKSGAARIAIEAGVPILPVTVRGANRVWAQDMKFPRFFVKVEIIYHSIFEIPQQDEKNDIHAYAEEMTKKLQKIIALSA